MKGGRRSGAACVVVLLGAFRCWAQAPPGTDGIGPLKELSEASRNPDRPVWYPAVEALGQLAVQGEEQRRVVWDAANVNSLGMKFASIPAGEFEMGPDYHRVVAVQVAHRVRLTRPFYIGITEVTNKQFQRIQPEFMPDAMYSPDPDAPAVHVMWDEAVRFCEFLSQREGVTYRLPTEAEWEYACRAGSASIWSFGETGDRLAEFGWCKKRVGKAARVALLKPNAWGLYDVHGNAFEWATGNYGIAYPAECQKDGIAIDPMAAAVGLNGVLRSGPWATENNSLACTCTARFPLPLLDRVPFDKDSPPFRSLVGFRIVREAEAP